MYLCKTQRTTKYVLIFEQSKGLPAITGWRLSNKYLLVVTVATSTEVELFDAFIARPNTASLRALRIMLKISN